MVEHSPESEIADLKGQMRSLELFLLRAQDREIGLEQELATARAGSNREHVVAELSSVKASASYKIGRAITFPFRALSSMFSFALRATRGIARRGLVWVRNRKRSV